MTTYTEQLKVSFEAAMVAAGYDAPARSPFEDGTYVDGRDQDRFVGFILALESIATPAPDAKDAQGEPIWNAIPKTPPVEVMEWYGDQFSVPVLLHDGEKILPVVARWNFIEDGWVGAQFTDGASPVDHEWLNEKPMRWMLLSSASLPRASDAPATTPATDAATRNEAAADERKAFEAWIRSLDSSPNFEIDEDGYCEDWDIQRAWSAWQARAAIAAHPATDAAPALHAGGDSVAVTLSGAQLLEALEFTAPDRLTDPDQLESEVTIQHCDGHSGRGYYCYSSDYPDEGAILLEGNLVIPAADAVLARLNAPSRATTTPATRTAADAVPVTAASAGASEAIAWVRKHPNGELSGDWLWNGVIEQVRKDSGVWFPLGYIAAPTAAVDDVGATDEQIVADWIKSRGTSMNGEAYAAAVQLVAFAKTRASMPERNGPVAEFHFGLGEVVIQPVKVSEFEFPGIALYQAEQPGEPGASAKREPGAEEKLKESVLLVFRAEEQRNRVDDALVGCVSMPERKAVTEPEIGACAFMIKSICLTKPDTEWTGLIEDRIRYMLAHHAAPSTATPPQSNSAGVDERKGVTDDHIDEAFNSFCRSMSLVNVLYREDAHKFARALFAGRD